jgi:hypothetical protein
LRISSTARARGIQWNIPAGRVCLAAWYVNKPVRAFHARIQVDIIPPHQKQFRIGPKAGICRKDGNVMHGRGRLSKIAPLFLEGNHALAAHFAGQFMDYWSLGN